MYVLYFVILIVAVTVVCHTETLERISAYTASLSFNMTIKVDAPSSVEDNLGSAEVLGLLSDSITVHHTPLEAYDRTTLSYYHATHLLLSHQQIYLVSTTTQNSSATVVFFDASQNQDLVNLKLKGLSLAILLIVENDNSLYVGYEKSSHRLLFVKSAIDVHESLDLRTSLLWRYPPSESDVDEDTRV